MENIPIQPISGRPGVRLNTVNLGSKSPSGIATRLRAAGVDWIASLGVAIRTNDKELLSLWIRLLPYLVVTNSTRRTKKGKRASKAALAALDALEGK